MTGIVHIRPATCLAACLAMAGGTLQASIDAERTRAALLEGVRQIHGGAQPGKMAVLGPDACVVADYPEASAGPFIAAAQWGRGRVIAVPDHQLLEIERFAGQGDSEQFFRNGIAWLADSTARELVIVCSRSETAEWLRENGFENATTLGDPGKDLAAADLLVGWLGPQVDDDALEEIRSFVRRGGGLFLAEYGVGYEWWWNKPVHRAPGNRLLCETGIFFSSGNLPYGDLVPVESSAGPPLTAGTIVAMIQGPGTFDAPERAAGAAAIAHLASALAPDAPLLARIERAVEEQLPTIRPTPGSPVDDLFEKALLTQEAKQLAATPADQVEAHRCAAELFGAIPQAAPRVETAVALDTSRSRWIPLGLYAPPGELVTLEFPRSMAGRGYKVRVNAHTDDISRRERWERPPRVHRWFAIDDPVVRVANAFGGSLFVDVGSDPPGLGEVSVRIRGAIRQPHFVLGRDDDRRWNSELRDLPAPFAVLESPGLIICTPCADVRDLSEPTRLMAWWNTVVTLEDELADQERTSPELMNIDVQISAGAAHSGYPYQCYDRHWGNPTDLDRLTTDGSWGDFHELGHNHQRSHWWTFDGDGEVTVNIFSSYVLETLNTGSTNGWAWVLDRDKVLNRARETWSSGKPYFEEPSLARRLAFYLLLRYEFGWEAFREVFASYEQDASDNPGALPGKDNQQKIDQWFLRFSNVSGRNIAPYMSKRWGIPVSAEAIAQVDHLPPWDIGG